MKKTKAMRNLTAAGVAAMLAGCAGYPIGGPAPAGEPAWPASPLSGYYTSPRYYDILFEQGVIEDRRVNGRGTVAPACEQGERRAAAEAQWAAAREAGFEGPLPSSDPDDE